MAIARHPGMRLFVHLDERSASFFALGLARASGRPVAVLCTSGTAAAELHPAVIEASYARVPLLVLTSDRPPELRDVGANQAIDQGHLFGGAVRWYADPGPPEPAWDGGRAWRRLAARATAHALGSPPGPVHLNLPFREPLVPAPGVVPQALQAAGPPIRAERGRLVPTDAMVEELAERLSAARRPLIVAGELGGTAASGLTPALDALARATGAPVLAEPSSQLRRSGGVGVVEAYDAVLRAASWATDHRPDFVLRLGAAPTSKALGRFLASSGAPTVVVDEDGGWRDPDLLAGLYLHCAGDALLAATAARLGVARDEAGWQEEWQRAGAMAAEALTATLAAQELFEGHVVSGLAGVLPAGARLMVGSSMAIRDVDTFWPSSSDTHLYGNRGASGIDGLVSTGLGIGAESGEAAGALLLGDLSLCHDMNGLWAVRRHRLKPLIVVCDNDGGAIFHQLAQVHHPDVFEELFGTPHGLDLARVAHLYELPFLPVDRAEDLETSLRAGLADRPALVCARFSRAASVAGHAACWQAVETALAGL